MKILTDKTCRLCKETEETPGHLAQECPGTSYIRYTYNALNDHPDENHGTQPRTTLDEKITEALFYTETNAIKGLLAWQEPTVPVAGNPQQPRYSRQSSDDDSP